MADQKITQLSENTSPITTDILAIVDDPGGTPATQKVTLASILGLIYPVGIIVELNVSTSPATLFGMGTWSALGTGRVTVAIDGGQTEFDVLGETGGAKTHTLTTAEMPAHTHDVSLRLNSTGGANKAAAAGNATGNGTDGGGALTTGGGGAHNNLQPYVVVYRWQRTA